MHTFSDEAACETILYCIAKMSEVLRTTRTIRHGLRNTAIRTGSGPFTLIVLETTSVQNALPTLSLRAPITSSPFPTHHLKMAWLESPIASLYT